MQKERVYVRDYRQEPPSRIYDGDTPIKCDGKWLIVDGFGYKSHKCGKLIQKGDGYYYKTCPCASENKVYCSVLCCYPYKCGNCNRRSCKECFIANANDICAYCMYLSDDCECPAFDENGDCVSQHDKEWCNLDSAKSMRKIIFLYEGEKYTPTEFFATFKVSSTRIVSCFAGNDRDVLLKRDGIVYYGKIMCQSKTQKGEKCTNRAYYREKDKYLCGQHSNKTIRTILPKDKKRAENRTKEIEEHISSIEAFRVENVKNKMQGKVLCCKMYMMKRVPLRYGYLNVFPNNKHQSRKDGFGCSSLSPMQLGPVDHKQPNLPKAKNIENYHQFSKCWPSEAENGEPTNEWRKRRSEGYNDSTPHRHKFDAKTMKELRKEVNGQNRNAPLFSVFVDKKGVERKFSYVECRYFYCKVYEVLAKCTEDYKKLIKLINEGTNIVICGYDAYEVTEDLYTHYCDPTRPFGHELVLYSLLTLEKNNYPWDRYKKEHEALYNEMSV